MSGATPDVSIVFETENECPEHRIRLTDALGAWERQTRADRVLECLVVSPRPPSATERRALQGLPARWIEEPDVRYYGLKNRGIAESRGAYVALADADVVPDPDWLATGLSLLEGGGSALALVTGRSRYLPGPFSREFALAMWPHLAQEAGETRELLAHNTLARGEALRRFVFGTPELRHGADRALARRLSEAGYGVRYEPTLGAVHNYTERWRDLWPEAVSLGWNYAQIDLLEGEREGGSFRNAVGRLRVLARRLLTSRRAFGIPAARIPLSLLFYGFFSVAAGRGYAKARAGEPEPPSRF